MIGASFDDGGAADVESWEELDELLRGGWNRVELASLGLSLERADGLLALDRRGQWRARHRRGLHRLGFRPLGEGDRWLWDIEQPLPDTDLSRFVSPVDALFGAERPQ